MTTSTKGLDILAESIDGLDALHGLIAEQLSPSLSLSGQQLGCLLEPLIAKLRKSQHLLRAHGPGGASAEPAPLTGKPLTPSTASALLHATNNTPQQPRKRA